MELLPNGRQRSVALTQNAYTRLLAPNRCLKLLQINNNSGADVDLFVGYPPWCLDFVPASSQYVQADAAATAAFLAATTGVVKVQFKVDDTAAEKVLFSIGDTSANEYFSISLSATEVPTVTLRKAAGVRWTLAASQALTPGLWYTLKVVHNGVTPTLYINGEKVVQTFSVSTSITEWFSALAGIDNVRVGCLNCNGAGNTLYFDGKIRWVEVFDKVSMATAVGDDRTCRLRFRFDEGTGTTLTDRSGVGANGTCVNTPVWSMCAEGMKIVDEGVVWYDIGVPTGGVFAYTTSAGISLQVTEAW